MRLTRLVVRMLLAGMTVLGAGVVSGQAYPNKPIRIITAEPGGGYDFTARVVAQGLSGSLGQQVIVDNRGGGVILAELVAKASPDGYTLRQNYPNRPIRIVTSGVGGGTDFAARLIAHGLTGSLGQQVIVDNRASGVIPGAIVSKAPPDGYTLLLATGILWLLPFLQNNVPYDPVKDFSPITLAVSSPNILAVTPSLPVKSVKELIAFAKARPRTLNYAMTAHGGGAHLAAELFQVMAGVSMVRVPYKSGGTAVTELISGQVQLYFVSAGSVVPHIKSGSLRALAVTSATPSALMPELPTVAASLPGYELVTVYGVLAPAKTPAAIINRLYQEIVRVLNKAEVKEKFLNSGVEPVGSSPEALGAMRESERTRMGKVIKNAGIRAD